MMQMYMSFCQLAYPHQVLLYSIASTVQHCCPTYVHAHLTQLSKANALMGADILATTHTHTRVRALVHVCVRVQILWQMELGRHLEISRVRCTVFASMQGTIPY